MEVNGLFDVIKWDESDISKIKDQIKITKADVEYNITGEINGKAIVQYLMYYSKFDKNDQHNSVAKFVGLIQFQGTILDKQGSFVMEDNGVYTSGKLNSEIKIIENSGLGEFIGIKGIGEYFVGEKGFIIKLDYQL